VTTGPNVPRGTNPTKAQEQALGLAYTQLAQYAQILGQEAVLQGLLGPREIDRIWDRHNSTGKVHHRHWIRSRPSRNCASHHEPFNTCDLG